MLKSKSKIFILYLFIALLGTNRTMAMNNNNNHDLQRRALTLIMNSYAQRMQSGSWIKKLLWLAIPVLMKVTFSRVLAMFLDNKGETKQEALSEIRTLMQINRELKEHLHYIKTEIKDKKTIQDLEKKYTNICIKLVDMQKKYIEKYEKAGKRGENPIK